MYSDIELTAQEREYEAKRDAAALRAQGALAVVKPALQARDWELVSAYIDADDEREMYENIVRDLLFQRLIPGSHRIIRRVMWDGDEPTEIAHPIAVPKPRSVAEAEAELERREEIAAGFYKAIKAALPAEHARLALDADNAYNQRDEAMQLRIFARLVHYRPDLRDLWGLVFAPPGVDTVDFHLAGDEAQAAPATTPDGTVTVSRQALDNLVDAIKALGEILNRHGVEVPAAAAS